MAAKVLQLNDILAPNMLATKIANVWLEWDSYKVDIKNKWFELRNYLNATDTAYTSNNKLPWNNKTTIPKLTQISDNLSANYLASIFPRRKWLIWEASNEKDASKDKIDSIRDYMSWVIDQQWYKDVTQVLINDYIQYGNCFSTVEWCDDRVQLEDKTQVGYVGPKLLRISPLDIVFNPTAPDWDHTPKIVRSLVSMGEAKEILERMSLSDGDKEIADALYQRMLLYRNTAVELETDDTALQDIYKMEGFGNFRDYLQSGYVEMLSFYGDLYDRQNDSFYKNYQICVMDRTQLAFKKPNPSYFGTAPIFHSGWRIRQDNLWAMGPLDNLVGMQYRLDHIENMKADLFDLTAFPPFKIKGIVEDFKWGPLEEVVMDTDGDVELMTPNVNIMQFNTELKQYLDLMEEMAGAPKEAMGIRSPGEKTMYEVQSLENSAGRIFQAKINQFEEQQVEPDLNAMLELARRNMDNTVIRVVDDEFKIATFKNLTPSDITGAGRIRPVAARHFAEKAQRLQNITALFNSPIGKLIIPHTSTVKMSQLADNLLEIEDWGIFQPYVQVVEQAEAQKMANAAHEEVLQQAQTPAGIVPGDDQRGRKNMPPVQGPPQQGSKQGAEPPAVMGRATSLPPAVTATQAPAGPQASGR
jgi:hypothetical protein